MKKKQPLKKIEKKEEKQKSFIKRNKEHLESVSDDMITDALKAMFEHDVMAYDIHYIEKRVRQILDEMFEPIDFTNEEIATLRKWLFNDKLKEAKKLKPDKIKDEEPLNQQREDRCFPVCVKIIKTIFSQKCPDWYLDEAIVSDEEIMAENRLRDYINVLFDGLMLSVNTSLQKAQNKVWGCDREEISMTRLDSILKS